MSTPLNLQDSKAKKENEDTQFVIFDFDETMVNAHYHEHLTKKGTVPKDDEDIIQKTRLLLDDPETGIKSKLQLQKIIKFLLEGNHKIAIISFSKYKASIIETLKALGLSSNDIQKINVTCMDDWAVTAPSKQDRYDEIQKMVVDAGVKKENVSYLDDNVDFINRYMKPRQPQFTIIPVDLEPNDSRHLDALSEKLRKVGFVPDEPKPKPIAAAKISAETEESPKAEEESGMPAWLLEAEQESKTQSDTIPDSSTSVTAASSTTPDDENILEYNENAPPRIPTFDTQTEQLQKLQQEIKDVANKKIETINNTAQNTKLNTQQYEQTLSQTKEQQKNETPGPTPTSKKQNK